MTESNTPPVCDYEGSDYRTRFWEGQGRTYEDQVERIALRRMMPVYGNTLIEIGAGFGRLAEEYENYERVVLFDYSRSLLREAQAKWGNDPRFIYVAGNWYTMPFVDGLFETLVQIRTLHHAADAPKLFNELARIAHPQGQYILEFANKQNLKAILRYFINKQEWSPFNTKPVEFVELNYNFHPRWILQELVKAGFYSERLLTTSHYRFAPLKKLVPTNLLVTLDSWAQRSGNLWQLTPSVFVLNRNPKINDPASEGQFFACPTCKKPFAEQEGDMANGRYTCHTCQKAWPIVDGLYDFKESVPLS